MMHSLNIGMFEDLGWKECILYLIFIFKKKKKNDIAIKLFLNLIKIQLDCFSWKVHIVLKDYLFSQRSSL